LPVKLRQKAYTFYSPVAAAITVRHKGKAKVKRAPFAYRTDPAVPPFADERPLIVFDGKCVLCSGFAQFVVRADHRAEFRLAAAQSPLGDALYRHFGLDPSNYETYILLQNGIAYFRSEAAIRILEGLGLPWRLASIGRLCPRAIRDRLYDVVARHRLRWFGTRPSCYIPSAAEADRFLS
jgi:predicted DCC family thiol-disulfide oxidoreductase YuxK